MNDKTVKPPPYPTYKTFIGLIQELRSHEVMPEAIDRSLLSKRSGTEQSALIAALKWFKLIEESGAPTKRLREFIAADDEEAKGMFKTMIEESYGSIADGTFALGSATTNMLAEKFREYEISGSTLTKSISFFLSAAKDAGFKVSPHAKAPPPPSSNGAKRRAKPLPTPPASPLALSDPPADDGKPKPPRDKMLAIPIPIFGGHDGVIFLPDQMSPKQWEKVIKMTEFILQNYRDTMAEEAPAPDDEDGGL